VQTNFESVLTAVATSPHPPLSVQLIQQLEAHLGASTSQVDWLEAGIAADIYFNGPSVAAVRERAERWLSSQLVDVVVQPVAQRRKKLLLADMDSTMIEQECLDELAAAVGLKAETAAITERAMRGELDFADALKERVANLRGLNVSALDTTRKALTFMPGGATLIKTLRARGVHCLLVSGGFTYFTDYVAGTLGFNGHHANELEIAADMLTGTVRAPILDKHAKRRILEETATQLGLALSETMAVGDGANDLPMLQTAGIGFAYHAKPAVNAAAPVCIRHSNLTALLYAQGYRASEFVT
jgi:phosphoserine phosphatase